MTKNQVLALKFGAKIRVLDLPDRPVHPRKYVDFLRCGPNNKEILVLLDDWKYYAPGDVEQVKE